MPASGERGQMLSPELSRRMEDALRGLQYGSVHVVVHDAQVVRIERIERTRLTVSPEAFPTSDGQPTDSSEAGHDAEGGTIWHPGD